MSLETWIGLRYLRAKKRNGFMSFIGVVSVVGIALGVMVLIVVLSVMNGFQKDVRAKLFELAPHLEMGYHEASDDNTVESLQHIAQGWKEVVAMTPVISAQALLAAGGAMNGVFLQGVDPLSYGEVLQGAELPQSALSQLTAHEYGIVLGDLLAQSLSLQVGDLVAVMTPSGSPTPAGMMPRIKQFRVVDIVSSGIYDFSRSLALIHIDNAKTLFKTQSVNLRMRLAHPETAPETTASWLTAQQKESIWMVDWSSQNRSYFEAVALEKKMMFIIMAFISLVASFNLVSSLVMTVNEKRSDIAILRTLGLSPRSVTKIFLVQGAVTGFLGTTLGVILGVLIAANISPIVAGVEWLIGRPLVNSQMYFLNYIPSDIQMGDVLTIALISLTLSFLVTLYPSYRAAQTQPAEALRYE